MINQRFLLALVFGITLQADRLDSQGVLGFTNSSQQTNGTAIGMIGGEQAGPDYFVQLSVGTETDSLSAVGMPVRYLGAGLFFAGNLEIPGLPGGTQVFYQASSWDGQRWGDELGAVPEAFVGRSDIGRLTLASGLDAIPQTVFEVTMVVPIPEPSGLVFFVVGGMVLYVVGNFWRHRRIHQPATPAPDCQSQEDWVQQAQRNR